MCSLEVGVASRRVFLKTLALGAAALAAPALFSTRALAAEAGGKVLIVYFSHSGNTRRLAGFIHDRVGGDMVELKTVKPYSEDYDTVVDEAKKSRRRTPARPLPRNCLRWTAMTRCSSAIRTGGATLPMPFFTLLEKYDLGNRTVIPFCTHEGSRFGRSERDLKALCPQARMLEGFEVRAPACPAQPTT